jgi:hypothetical protein
VISQGKAKDRQQGVFQKLIKQIHQYRVQIEGGGRPLSFGMINAYWLS